MVKRKNKKKSKASGLYSPLAEKLSTVKLKEAKKTPKSSFEKKAENASDCDRAWSEWQSENPTSPLQRSEKTYCNQKLQKEKTKKAPYLKESEALLLGKLHKIINEKEAHEKELLHEIALLRKKNAHLHAQLKNEKERCAHWSALYQEEQSKKHIEIQRAEKFLNERDSLKAGMLELKEQTLTLSSLLETSGIPSDIWSSIVIFLMKREAKKMLNLLKVEKKSGRAFLANHFALCCNDPICTEELSIQKRSIFYTSNAQQCSYCLGSSNRRAFLQMVRVCKAKGRKKIIIVGGDPDVLSEVRQLAPTGFILRMITGTGRRNQQQANNDLRSADLVVVWVPSGLPHKISELYTKRKSHFPGKVALVSRRGISSLSSSIIHFLEGSVL